jgi:hypothetical protein
MLFWLIWLVGTRCSFYLPQQRRSHQMVWAGWRKLRSWCKSVKFRLNFSSSLLHCSLQVPITNSVDIRKYLQQFIFGIGGSTYTQRVRSILEAINKIYSRMVYSLWKLRYLINRSIFHVENQLFFWNCSKTWQENKCSQQETTDSARGVVDCFKTMATSSSQRGRAAIDRR